MKEQGYFSVVMYKDCDLQSFLQQLYDVAHAMSDFVENYEIIVILGERLDETSNGLLQEAKRTINGHVILVTLSQCQNKACGIMAGMDLSIGDYIYEIETHVNRDVCQYMHKMYNNLIEERNDMVFLRPHKKGILNGIVNKIFEQRGKASIVLGGNIMRLVTRRSLNRMEHQREEENTRNLMYQLCGLHVKHMHVKQQNKVKHGQFLKEVGYFLRAKKIGSKCAYILSGIYLMIFLGFMFIDNLDKTYVVPLFLLSFSILLILLGMLMNHLLLLYRETKNTVSYTVLEVRRLK